MELVSCMCVTYARPELIVEAIECFLRQDYAGPKELVVLNDLGTQELVFEHPEVVMINVPRRFRTLGEKRNALAGMCNGDILLPWDDDDIYMPWRISTSIDRLGEDAYWNSRSCWFRNGKAAYRRIQPNCHGTCVFRRDLFRLVDGYPQQDRVTDQLIEGRWREHRKAEVLADEEIFYVYRWGTNSYHQSACQYDQIQGWANKRAQPGRHVLEPTWREDYVSLHREAVAAIKRSEAERESA